MVVTLLSSLFVDRTGYYLVLLYCSAMCALFLVSALGGADCPSFQNRHFLSVARFSHVSLDSFCYYFVSSMTSYHKDTIYDNDYASVL